MIKHAIKACSWLLIFVMLVALMPTTASAEDAEKISVEYVRVATIRVNTYEVDREGNRSDKIFYQRPGSSRWYSRQHAYNHVVRLENGEERAAYCMEPWREISVEDYDGFNGTLDEHFANEEFTEYLTKEKLHAIGLAMLYGGHGVVSKDDSLEVACEKLSINTATQIIVWEIALGWREATYPYKLLDDSFIRRFADDSDGISVWCSRIDSEDTVKLHLDIQGRYNSIVKKMQTHYEIPSFMAKTKGTASTYTLQPNSDGTYSVTLEDTNGVLNKLDFVDGNGLTYKASGNKLTIIADETFTGSTEVRCVKLVPDFEQSVFTLWDAGTSQQMASVSDAVYDPIPAYMNLRIEKGSLTIQKETNTGTNLSGHQFEVGYYDDEGEAVLHTTATIPEGENKVTVTQLDPGMWWVREVGGPADVWDSPYWACDGSTHDVEVVLGGNATVVITNTQYGFAEVQKVMRDGGSLEGWEYTLFEDAECTKPLAVGYTDEAGVILFKDLTPGTTYYFKETGDSHGRDSNGWWIMDDHVHEATVVAGETVSVTSENLVTGALTIQKYVNDEKWTSAHAEYLAEGESISFRLWNDEYGYDETKSINEDGTVSFAGLRPGTYKLQEVDCPEGFWYCDAAVHSVTIRGEQTATYFHYNECGGGMTIVKTADDNNVANIEFYIYDAATDEEVFHGFTLDDGTLPVGKLHVGEYIVKEIVPDGYICDGENPVTVTVKAHEVTEVPFKNLKNVGSLHIEKETNTDGDLDGWMFAVYKDAACERPVAGSPFVTDENGQITIRDLRVGTYYVKEIGGTRFDDVAWKCDTEAHEVKVNRATTKTVTITNTLLSGKVTVEKKNYVNEYLAGATFKLEWWSEDAQEWLAVTYNDKDYAVIGGCSANGLEGGCLTTDGTGTIVFSNLYPGLKYRLTEVEAPEGYVLLSDFAFEGELPADNGFEVSRVVYNSQGYTLPASGSNSLMSTTVIGAMLLMCAVGMGIISVADRKKLDKK